MPKNPTKQIGRSAQKLKMLKMTKRLYVTQVACKKDSIVKLTAKIPIMKEKHGGSTNILIMLRGKVVLLPYARLTRITLIRGTTRS